MGGDAPAMDARWAGFVDLRRDPERVKELAEVRQFPALGAALARLNGSGSAVWTAKCDVWAVEDGAAWDADELDAPADQAHCAMGCYIDLLGEEGLAWSEPAQAERVCREICAGLKAITLGCCRADLVIRRAMENEGCTELGVTAYLTGCGATAEAAGAALGAAMGAFADAVVERAPAAEGRWKLQ